MIRYALAIGLSSFLIFLVQPIIARYILPWYGGSAAVWTTCLLFFQAALLAGYAYAHFIRLKLPTRAQVGVHLGLLTCALVLLPITPAEALKPTGGEDPFWGILWLLASTVGIPYWLVSSSGPLLQHWFSVAYPERSPYRLYALSNAASLLGLLSYPFFFEPMLALGTQTLGWSVGFGLYGFACLWCGMGLWNAKGAAPSPEAPEAEIEPDNTRGTKVLDWVVWVVLAAGGSVLLLATTNQMGQDIAVTPFLWVLPLSLYLVSFIISFDREAWYDRRVWIPLFAASIVFMFIVQTQRGRVETLHQLIAYSGLLLSGCMICHGELVRLKPPATRLTGFYLMMSLGGALGGAFVALASPHLFEGYHEIYVGVGITVIAALVAVSSYVRANFGVPMRVAWTISAAMVLAAMAFNVYSQVHEWGELSIHTHRNFYGVLRVYDYDKDTKWWVRTLVHGRIVHGAQFQGEDPERPTRYYAPESGVALAIDHHPKRVKETPEPLRVGVIGLGTGTLTAYGREGDVFRIYEIDEAVVTAAETHFSYLKLTEAKVDIVLGDARISMESELRRGEPQRYDILALDAFSGDAIPVHLITKEAMALYTQHLAEGGVLAIHISNRHLDLWPVVHALAVDTGMDVRFVSNAKDEDLGYSSADWILISNDTELLDHPLIEVQDETAKHLPVEDKLWTDDYSNLLTIMR